MNQCIRTILLSLLFALQAGCDQSGTTGDTTDPGNNDPQAPVLAAIGDKTVTSGDSLSFTVSATDPNGLALMYSTDGSAGSGANPYTETGNNAGFNANNRQFTWNTTNVALGDYYIEFSVMNSAALSDSETIRITVQNTTGQFEQGHTLYNSNCTGSSCHKNEDTSTGGFSILCSSQSTIKTETERGPGSMPVIDLSADEEAAIAYYLQNVRPEDCNI